MQTLCTQPIQHKCMMCKTIFDTNLVAKYYEAINFDINNKPIFDTSKSTPMLLGKVFVISVMIFKKSFKKFVTIHADGYLEYEREWFEPRNKTT